MNRIRLLSEQVANQIAAGEVIERPASVVKELVENALDAQAGRITVEIQAGGRSLIRVTDDGLGMSRDDALLCFDRHATSKIHRAEDLESIVTLGFRGEALPSIASVSRLSLTTRERDPETVEATQVLIHGGRILDARAAAGPPGTCVEVRSLFFNLPARRKFLKSEETERAHIHHYLVLAALAFPNVGFTFLQDQRVIWQLPPVAGADNPATRLDALRERLRALYGADLDLVPIDALRGETNPDPDEDAIPAPDAAVAASPTAANPPASRIPGALRLWGFVGAPGVSRATREDQHLFVNRRPVENRGLNYALYEGYHTSLMKGRYPVCCLFLELDPARVDVNVHPAKREVRFRDDWNVRRFVADAVRRGLFEHHAGREHPAPPAPNAAPDVTPTLPPAPSATSHEPEKGLPRPPAGDSRPPLQWSLAPENPPAATTASPDQQWIDYPGPACPAAPPQTPAAQPGATPTANIAPPPLTPAPPAPAATASPTSPPPLLAVPLRVLGVIGRLYAVLESDRGLVLLDQHAAHERVLFEQVLERLERGAAPSQRLLLPETVELSPRDAAFLRDQLAVLGRLGVGLSEFGDRTFLLEGLPPFVHVGNARQFVIELVDALKAAGGGVNPLRLGENAVAKTVCRHAVKANDPLRLPEVERLVEDLRCCAMPYTCPHGRPTMIEFSYRELEKRFGRAQ